MEAWFDCVFLDRLFDIDGAVMLVGYCVAYAWRWREMDCFDGITQNNAEPRFRGTNANDAVGEISGRMNHKKGPNKMDNSSHTGYLIPTFPTS